MDTLLAAFPSLPRSTITQASAHFVEAELDYGELLVTEGELDASAALLVDGELGLAASGCDLGTLAPGELVGAEQLLGDALRPWSVRTTAPSRLLLVEAESWRALHHQQSPVIWALERAALATLSGRIRDWNSRIRGHQVVHDHPDPPRSFWARLAASMGLLVPDRRRPADPLSFLADNPLFAEASAETLHALSQRLQHGRFTPGEPVFRQDMPPDGLFLLVRGEVEVLLADPNEARPVANLEPGSLFGLTSVLTGFPHSATCLARTDVDVLWLSPRRWRRLVAADDRLGSTLRTAGIRALSVVAAQASAELVFRELQARRLNGWGGQLVT